MYCSCKDIYIPSELITRATAELDEEVKKELEVADPQRHIAIAILEQEKEDDKE